MMDATFKAFVITVLLDSLLGSDLYDSKQSTRTPDSLTYVQLRDVTSMNLLDVPCCENLILISLRVCFSHKLFPEVSMCLP